MGVCSDESWKVNSRNGWVPEIRLSLEWKFISSSEFGLILLSEITNVISVELCCLIVSVIFHWIQLVDEILFATSIGAGLKAGLFAKVRDDSFQSCCAALNTDNVLLFRLCDMAFKFRVADFISSRFNWDKSNLRCPSEIKFSSEPVALKE